MPAQVSTLDEVLALAQGLKVLSSDQLAKIQKLAPSMDEGGLEKLKGQLEKIRDENRKDMDKKVKAYEKLASYWTEKKADSARAQLQKTEDLSRSHDAEDADHLLSNLV